MDSSFDKLKQIVTNAKTITPTSKDENILIIDGTNTFIRVFASVPALNDNGQHIGGVIGFLRSIGSNIRQFQCTRCIVVFDGAGGSVRRRKIYPEYKGNRKNKNKLNRFNEFADLVDEQESMRLQFLRIFDYLKLLPVTVVIIDNIEADDTIAYIAKQYYDEKSKITIVSTDRDFLQLVNSNIQVYSPIKRKLYTSENLSAEIGFKHENYLLYRILSGDSSDNIPGVLGVGLKTMIKQFPELTESILSPDDIINIAIDKKESGSKLKIFNSIIDNKNIIEMNFQLMQLGDTNISSNSKMLIRKHLDEPISKLNKIEFRKLYMDDKIYTVIKDVDTWLRDTFTRLNIYSKK